MWYYVRMRMKTTRRGLVGGVTALAAISCLWARDAQFEQAPYMDPKLSVEERMEDLISRMTLVDDGVTLRLYVNDCDGGKRTFREWTPGIGGVVSAAQFGHLAEERQR